MILLLGIINGLAISLLLETDCKRPRWTILLQAPIYSVTPETIDPPTIIDRIGRGIMEPCTSWVKASPPATNYELVCRAWLKIRISTI